MSPENNPQRALPLWRSDPRFERYVRLFNDRRFFEAHEVLEELWLEIPPAPAKGPTKPARTSGDDREFLQGLIQIAVALEHRRRGNPPGARKVLDSAARRLARYGDFHAGIAVGPLMKNVAAYLAGSGSEPPRFEANEDAADFKDTESTEDSL